MHRVYLQVGVIYVDGEWYFIEPLAESAAGNASGDDRMVEHVIYPRNATTHSPAQQHLCHVTGQSLTTCTRSLGHSATRSRADARFTVCSRWVAR